MHGTFGQVFAIGANEDAAWENNTLVPGQPRATLETGRAMNRFPLKLILYATLIITACWVTFSHWDQIRERVIARVDPKPAPASAPKPAQDPTALPDERPAEAQPKAYLLGNPDEAREALVRARAQRLKREEEARKAEAHRHLRKSG